MRNMKYIVFIDLVVIQLKFYELGNNENICIIVLCFVLISWGIYESIIGIFKYSLKVDRLRKLVYFYIFIIFLEDWGNVFLILVWFVCYMFLYFYIKFKKII